MIGNKISDKITKVSITSTQNNLETVTNEEENVRLTYREIPTKRYISPEERQKIMDDLRLI